MTLPGFDLRSLGYADCLAPAGSSAAAPVPVVAHVGGKVHSQGRGLTGAPVLSCATAGL